MGSEGSGPLHFPITRVGTLGMGSSRPGIHGSWVFGTSDPVDPEVGDLGSSGSRSWNPRILWIQGLGLVDPGPWTMDLVLWDLGSSGSRSWDPRILWIQGLAS
jgi:hypothetical protein